MHKAAQIMMFILACVISACSGSAPASHPPDDSATYHFEFTTPAGTEVHWCQYAKMPHNGGETALVGGFRWKDSAFHHWALFRTHGLTDVSFTNQFDCFAPGAVVNADAASIVSQPTGPSELVYPIGYAIPFASDEIVMVQAHTINATNASVHPTLDLTVLLADPAKTPNTMGEFQFYDPYIVVPAHAALATASMRCAVPQAIDIAFMATHQHVRGVGFNVYLDLPGQPLATTPLITAGSWDNPASKVGIQHIPAGSNFRVYCDYHGDNADAYQGPDKLVDEMCQFYGFYAPPGVEPAALPFEACVPTFVPTGTGDMYGTGKTTCGGTLACISACAPNDAPAIRDGRFDVGACWQKCMVDSCPPASGQFNTVFACLGSKCATECTAGAADPTCQTCVATNCAAEVTTCQAGGC